MQRAALSANRTTTCPVGVWGALKRLGQDLVVSCASMFTLRHPCARARPGCIVLCSGHVPGNVGIRKALRRCQQDAHRPNRRSLLVPDPPTTPPCPGSAKKLLVRKFERDQIHLFCFHVRKFTYGVPPNPSLYFLMVNGEWSRCQCNNQKWYIIHISMKNQGKKKN